jgi:hypothetical protein
LLHNGAFSCFSGTQEENFVVATCKLFGLFQLSINLGGIFILFCFYDSRPTANATRILPAVINLPMSRKISGTRADMLYWWVTSHFTLPVTNDETDRSNAMKDGLAFHGSGNSTTINSNRPIRNKIIFDEGLLIHFHWKQIIQTKYIGLPFFAGRCTPDRHQMYKA